MKRSIFFTQPFLFPTNRREDFFKRDYEMFKSKYPKTFSDDMTPFVVFEAAQRIIDNNYPPNPTKVEIRSENLEKTVEMMIGSSYFDSEWWNSIKPYYENQGWKVEYGLYESEFNIKWPMYKMSKQSR